MSTLVEAPSTQQQRELLQHAINGVALLAQDSLNRMLPDSRQEVDRRMHAGEALTIIFTLQSGAVSIDCLLKDLHLFSIEVPPPSAAKREAFMH